MSRHMVEIDWDQVKDEDLKEALRRILQQVSPPGFARTDGPVRFTIEFKGYAPGRYHCFPPYIRVY